MAHILLASVLSMHALWTVMTADLRSPRDWGLSAAGLAFIAERAGYHPRPYNSGEGEDSPLLYDHAYHGAGDCLVGYGHYLHPYACHPRETIWFLSEETAYRLLRYDLVYAQCVVRELVRVPVSQAQFDALVALVYDCGRLCLEGSPLLQALNAGEDAAVTQAWLTTGVVSAGETLPVWQARRREQSALFDRPACAAPQAWRMQ